MIKLTRMYGNTYKLSSNDLIEYMTAINHSAVTYHRNLSHLIIGKNNLNAFLSDYRDTILDNTSETIRKKSVALIDIGSTMKLSPYLYQKESINFILNNNNSLLVLPCGAGKTPTGIGAFLEAHKRGIISGKGIIVVKASLKIQWVKEVSKFSDLKAVVIESPSSISSSIKAKISKINKQISKLDKVSDLMKLSALRAQIAELEKDSNEKFNSQFEGNDIYVVNYEALLNDSIKKKLHDIKADFIFADEVHMIGSRESKRSKALHEFQAKIKVGATATPITKNPENIFSIFKFIQPTLFTSWSKFAADFIKWAGRGRISGVRNIPKLTSMISPYIMIKTKEEISDQLPQLQVIQRFIDLTEEQYTMNTTIMEQLEELKIQDLALRAKCKNDAEVKTNPELLKIGAQILALQTFAQEIANEPKLLEMSESEFAKKYVIKSKKNPKLELFMDIVEEIIESGEKVAVFSKFERMQTVLTESINKYNPSVKIAYINGSISSKDRYVEAYDKFRDNPEYKVLLLSNSGAEGINLSQCRYLIEYDLADSYAIQTQRHGRLERADSIHKNVTVYQLIANNSWDEIAMKIIEKKEGYDLELIKNVQTGRN